MGCSKGPGRGNSLVINSILKYVNRIFTKQNYEETGSLKIEMRHMRRGKDLIQRR